MPPWQDRGLALARGELDVARDERHPRGIDEDHIEVAALAGGQRDPGSALPRLGLPVAAGFTLLERRTDGTADSRETIVLVADWSKITHASRDAS
ncbi:hypothetical protein JOD54_006657 [Actinokineospora baliensis]|uniref:hypothetical protein n=1 Tax=Actinokineospora baliensis TaxID=547056 RepID=UPI00195A9FA2|nr:hypothetical protein [Actinokineospora baliensis]MBM7776453.1 hypothetical protein [Actinokineospora baliensis]